MVPLTGFHSRSEVTESDNTLAYHDAKIITAVKNDDTSSLVVITEQLKNFLIR